MSATFLTITDWYTRVPVIRIWKARTIIKLDATLYPSIVDVLVNSEVVAQYDFVASKPFTLWKGGGVKPANFPFMPVIRFRIGGRTFQYRLFDNPYKQLDVTNIPLYDKQLIPATFSIVFYTCDSTLELADAVVLANNEVIDFPVISNPWTGTFYWETSLLTSPSGLSDLSAVRPNNTYLIPTTVTLTPPTAPLPNTLTDENNNILTDENGNPLVSL